MPYNLPASPDQIERAAQAVRERGIAVERAAGRAEALARLIELLPAGGAVMTESSQTLIQIGFMKEIQTGGLGWRDLRAEMLAENDPQRRAERRRETLLADWCLGSVHAIAETGEIVIASQTGSQLSPYLSSRNVVWVAGVQKIVPTLADAFRRVREYCVPMVEELGLAQGRAGLGTIGKILIFERELARLRRNVRLILVDEVLGF